MVHASHEIWYCAVLLTLVDTSVPTCGITSQTGANTPRTQRSLAPDISDVIGGIQKDRALTEEAASYNFLQNLGQNTNELKI